MRKTNMVVDETIKCPACGKDSGYTKNQFSHMVLQYDVLCKHCRGVVIKAPDIRW